MLNADKHNVKKILYRGKIFTVEEYNVKVRGERHLFVRAIEPSSSVIIPVLKGGLLLLEKQYRHAVKKWIYELPAGHMDKGESAKSAAARELKEETGYRAKSLRFLFRTYELPNLTTASRYYYLATGLMPGKRSLEPVERINVFKVPIKRALEMVDRNVIDDPATICGILYYSRKFDRVINSF